MTQPDVVSIDFNRLQGIVTPPAVSYRPQTIGWYVVGAVLLLVIAWVVSRVVAYRRANRYRRAALDELIVIEQRLTGKDRSKALVELDALVKRVALTAYPRERVASLSGAAWLSFLDATFHGTRFSAGDGKALADLPYQSAGQREQFAARNAAALVTLVRQWIRGHRVPA
ncbi:MAG TPA: DUF4381 domain-containing protein [Vicinamibacterales bacterium]|nr:DUF4381 domain-containing protein [Vicinamibacterales bacterium]